MPSAPEHARAVKVVPFGFCTDKPTTRCNIRYQIHLTSYLMIRVYSKHCAVINRVNGVLIQAYLDLTAAMTMPGNREAKNSLTCRWAATGKFRVSAHFTGFNFAVNFELVQFINVSVQSMAVNACRLYKLQCILARNVSKTMIVTSFRKCRLESEPTLWVDTAHEFLGLGDYCLARRWSPADF